MKILGTLIILAGTATFAFAGFQATAPEINASSAVAAITLVSGGLLVIRSRRKK